MREDPLQEVARENAGNQQKIAKAFQNVYATPDGRAVLEHIMTNICQIDKPFRGTVRTSEDIYLRMAESDIGHEIHRLIHADIGERTEQPKVNTGRAA